MKQVFHLSLEDETYENCNALSSNNLPGSAYLLDPNDVITFEHACEIFMHVENMNVPCECHERTTWTSIQDLFDDGIDDSQVAFLKDMPIQEPHINSLQNDGFRHLIIESPSWLQYLPRNIVRVCMDDMNDEILKIIARKTPELVTLEVGPGSHITNFGITSIGSSLQNLEHLCIYTSADLYENSIPNLTRLLTRLKTLCVIGNTNMTHAEFLNLVDRLPHLICSYCSTS